MDTQFGQRLRQALDKRDNIPFIGCYDAFSASIAAKYYDGIFVSGFGFAASFYGLPDIGFIAWSDMQSYVQRLRTILPHHHLLVDIDDGYADTEVACHVTSMMETVGASGIVIEDQQRPRRCGHYDGKQIMPLDQFMPKLNRVLATRRELIVIARTDSADEKDIEQRVIAFAEAGADAILVDAVKDLQLIRHLNSLVEKPFVFNQIAGGNSPTCDLADLHAVGVSMTIYSTPCLFAAQAAIEEQMQVLQDKNGLLEVNQTGIDVKTCSGVLNDNLARRDTRMSNKIDTGINASAENSADINQRIEKLSPVKQELLKLKLQKQAQSVKKKFPTHPSVTI